MSLLNCINCGCHAGPLAALQRNPCSQWESAKKWEAISFKRPSLMSTDNSERPMAPPTQPKYVLGTRYLRPKSEGSVYRGSVIVLIFFCYSVTSFDNNLCFCLSRLARCIFSQAWSILWRLEVTGLNQKIFVQRKGAGWDAFLLFAWNAEDNQGKNSSESLQTDPSRKGCDVSVQYRYDWKFCRPFSCFQ